MSRPAGRKAAKKEGRQTHITGAGVQSLGRAQSEVSLGSGKKRLEGPE